jgi:hypothetical protein
MTSDLEIVKEGFLQVSLTTLKTKMSSVQSEIKVVVMTITAAVDVAVAQHYTF